MPALEDAVYLDAAEEKMLRAIVHFAVVSAATGYPFAGEFRHYRIRATRLLENESGVAKVAVRILDGVGAVAQLFQGSVLADRPDRT